MNLVIDSGNTRTKIGVFNKNELIELFVLNTNSLLKELKPILKKYSIINTIISSVNKEDLKLIDYLNKNSLLIKLSHKTKIPFKNVYKTPKTLGVDRIGLIAGAVQQFKNKNTLVIDAGSCITYDFVNANKEYFGGIISPGIQFRYKAMHEFTANLPLLKPKKNVLVGNSTKNAMHLGVINGIFLEIEGIIKQHKEKYNNLTIVLTGGDTNFLVNLLKSSIFANPNFLLQGLNHILNYNLHD